jgi:hypothetical protein
VAGHDRETKQIPILDLSIFPTEVFNSERHFLRTNKILLYIEIETYFPFSSRVFRVLFPEKDLSQFSGEGVSLWIHEDRGKFVD